MNRARKEARRVPRVCLELLCLARTIWTAVAARLEGLRAYLQSRRNKLYCLSLKSKLCVFCPLLNH